MNPLVQRYLPPVLVVGATLFFGWPPSQPLDLGDDIVRATSVRWRAEELDDLPPIQVQTDPFREVLVADASEQQATENALPEPPAGPDPEDIQAGLRLDGFADLAGRRWAVLNGRPRLVGDSVVTTGAEAHVCKIVAVESDHVVVRCEETVTKIRAVPQGTSRPSNGVRKPGAAPASRFGATQALAPDPASIAIPPDGNAENDPPPQI